MLVFCFLSLGLLKLSRASHLFIYSAVNLIILAAVLVPLIDAKLQEPLFRYYKSIAQKDVYVETMHFKSYAHYYYAKVEPLSKSCELNKMNQAFLKGKNMQDLSQDSFKRLRELQFGFYRDAPRDKAIYLIYKSNYNPLPKAEEGLFRLGEYGAYTIFLRPKRH